MSKFLAIFTRTNIVFSIAGCLFALGTWGVVWGATCKATTADQYQFDSIALIPGFLSLLCFILLNGFSDRTRLTSEGWDIFNTGSSRPMKFFIFACFTLSLVSIAMVLILGAVRYIPQDFGALTVGLCAQTIAYTISSWVIFFGRKIEDSLF